MQAEITVRRVRAEEWERLRATRLRALADAPMAFGSTLADEQTRPDEFWRGRAAGGASDDDRATFIVERGGAWVGIGTCVLEEGGAGERPAWVFGMWVDPAVRRQGMAQALLRVLAGSVAPMCSTCTSPQRTCRRSRSTSGWASTPRARPSRCHTHRPCARTTWRARWSSFALTDSLDTYIMARENGGHASAARPPPKGRARWGRRARKLGSCRRWQPSWGLQFPNDRVFLRAAKPSKNRATVFDQVRSGVPGVEGDGGQRMTTSVLAHARTDTSTQQPLLEVRGLTTEFRTRAGPLCAVNDVSFETALGARVDAMRRPGHRTSRSAQATFDSGAFCLTPADTARAVTTPPDCPASPGSRYGG